MLEDNMTPEQRDWMERHPHYEPVGPPQPGVSFVNCGTLYANGRFEPLQTMKPMKLEEGCFCVGVRK
jgi:hypothetical protein